MQRFDCVGGLWLRFRRHWYGVTPAFPFLSRVPLIAGGADLKIKYATPVTITVTLASLATNAQAVYTAGRQSTAVDNSSNLYDDVLVTGKIRTGTGPTSGRQLAVYVFAQLDDTPTYPDTLGASDAAVTFTSGNVLNSAIRLGQGVRIDSNSDRDYFFNFSVSGLFGGIMPKRWGIYVAHDSGVNLNSTGSNHSFRYQGITYQTT